MIGDTVPVSLDRTTKNYAIYESEDPLEGDQPIPSLYLALERFDGSPPELVTINVAEYED